MAQKWKLPEYKEIRYTLNTSKDWYQVFIKPLGFKKMPDELKIKPTICPKIREIAPNVIEGHTVNKEKTFFTGLRPTAENNLFFGDDGYSHPKTKSFILFRFSPDQKQLTCFFFNDYTPPKPMRELFIETFLKSN